MDRRAAGRTLGVETDATRAEARLAYMRLLSEVNRNLAQPERDRRIGELEAAYAAFSTEQPTQVVAGGTDKPADKAFLSIPMWVWVVMGLVALVVIMAVNNSSSNGTPGPGVANQPAIAPADPAPTVGWSAQAPEPSTDTGASGLVGTCWADVVGAVADANGAVSIREVDCSSSAAEWFVYEEVATSNACVNDYVTTTDGVTLCLRRK